jgi:hypothetical protein
VAEVTTRPWRLRAGAVATLLVVTTVLTGCGEETSAADAAPELADRLERVDAAIVADRPERARKAVRGLVNETTEALMDGRITTDQADEILRAARALLERLPAD